MLLEKGMNIIITKIDTTEKDVYNIFSFKVTGSRLALFLS